MQRRYQLLVITVGLLAFFLLSGFGLFHRKKYDTPITKDTLQPDKILFDRAIKNIEHGDYEAARLTLNTLINTYDTSEYLAKAKLAIADSRFREGGAHGLAQAEAEYRDFILFYPSMKDVAESRLRQIQPRTAGDPTAGTNLAPPPPPTSVKLTSITVKGLSDSARDELLSHLPVREGAEW